jgi:hypothetical protein
MFEAASDAAARLEQLRAIVAVDAAARGEDRTPRVRTLAARSALVLAEQQYRAFGEIALVQPFERSLKRKKQSMDATLDAFGRLVDYEVGEVTAAATFYMAEVYYDFSQALMNAERPANLAGAALEEYEDALEEEAFPFEEQAIAVHEKNLELMRAGYFDAWIEKSLDALAKRMPGRYAKRELGSGLIASIDGYAYQPPAAKPTETAASTAPPEETPPADADAAPPASQSEVTDAVAH